MGNGTPQSARIQMSENMRAWLQRGGNFPEQLIVHLASGATMHFQVEGREPDGRVLGVADRCGFKGFTLRVRSKANNRVYAAKLCLREDYSAEKLQEEMLIASEIDADAPIVSHEWVGRVDPLPHQPDKDVRWLCFVGRWIDGETLEQVILRTPEKLLPELCIVVLKNLLSAILYLERKRLKHDDLHLGNVMLSRVPSEIVDSSPGLEPYRIHVIDLGSIKRLDTPTAKIHDDWSQYASCIVKIHNVLHRNRDIAARYPQLLRRLYEFAQLLADEDPGRHFIDSKSLMAHLDDAKRSLHRSAVETHGASLASPFAAISAEHLANDRVLLALFVDNLGWFDSVRDTTPAVLTGPRGCGKSMVFRYLSLRTHLASQETAAKALVDLNFVGVYIGCASDLQNDLLWIKREPGRAEQLAPQIVTFFNFVASRELFRTLSIAARSEHVGAALGITHETTRSLIQFASEQLGLPNAHVAVAGIDPAQSIADELDRQRIKLARAMLEGRSFEYELPDTFLRDLTRAAVKLMPGLEDKPLVFLLDDFTQQRLGEVVQRILNPILWQRDAACAFKVSCEPFGFSNSHIDDAKLDPNREYVVIDTGQRMLDGSSAEAAQRRRFVEGLIDKRLDAANYSGRVEGLIGRSEHRTDPDLAMAIRSAEQGKSYHYHGLEVLANAWSGDVATILFMVREMFQRAGVAKDTVKTISRQHQHEAMVYVSKALVERVEYCHPYGTEMRGVLDLYARLARKLLVEGPLQKDDNAAREAPQRRYRMEVTLDEEGGIVEQLERITGGDQAGLLYKELIRRSIFIDLGESRSKDHKRTLRVQVRSSLLPHYGTSLVRKNYMAVHNLQEFTLLLGRKAEFSERIWNRSADDAMYSMNDLFREFDL